MEHGARPVAGARTLDDIGSFHRAEQGLLVFPKTQTLVFRGMLGARLIPAGDSLNVSFSAGKMFFPWIPQSS